MPSTYATSEPAPEPRADAPDAARTRELHEVRDEQEVVGETETLDQPELVLEPRDRALAFVRTVVATLDARAPEPQQVAGAGLALRDRRVRKDRRSQLELEPAALGERRVVRERRGPRLGNAGRAARRANAALPLARRREPRLTRRERIGRHALEQLAASGGDRRAVRVVIAGCEQRAVAGRDERHAERPRRRHALAEPRALDREAADAEPQADLDAAIARERHAGDGTARRADARAEQRRREPRRLDDHLEPACELAE
jgi:hypothetical protein